MEKRKSIMSAMVFALLLAGQSQPVSGAGPKAMTPGGEWSRSDNTMAFKGPEDRLLFRIEKWYINYNAHGNTRVQVGNSNLTKRGNLVFHRDDLPPDTVHQSSSGIVTLHYPMSEFPNIRNLLSDSDAVFFEYFDWGVQEQGYLFINGSSIN